MSIIEKVRNTTTMSVGELEKALGFGNGTIYKWETSSPTVDKIIKVADYLNVSVDYLLGRSEERNLQSHVNINGSGNNTNVGNGNTISSDEAKSLILPLYNKLPDVLKQEVMVFISNLTSWHKDVYQQRRCLNYSVMFYDNITRKPNFWDLSMLLLGATDGDIIILFNVMKKILEEKGIFKDYCNDDIKLQIKRARDFDKETL